MAYADRTPTLGTTSKSKNGGVDKLRIGKGLVDKVLNTGKDGGDCWEVENYEKMKNEIKKVDTDMSLKGYKTIAVAMSEVSTMGD